MKRLLAMTALVTLSVAAFGGVAHAGGGNSAAARACQKGGWESQHRSDGTAFTNQGDCVSYAAGGGTFEGPCLNGVDLFADARITGPIDTFHNGTGYSSHDGTCTGTIAGLETVVSAASAPAANALCLTLEPTTNLVQHLIVWYPTAPADLWLCLRPA